MLKPKKCPVEIAMSHLGKKWTIHLIRDMFRGVKRFKDFLVRNPQLSSKVLSGRLQELEKDGLIERKVLPDRPVLIEYCLTERGEALNRVMIELSIFSIVQFPEEVFDATSVPKYVNEQAIAEARERFGLS